MWLTCNPASKVRLQFSYHLRFAVYNHAVGLQNYLDSLNPKLNVTYTTIIGTQLSLNSLAYGKMGLEVAFRNSRIGITRLLEVTNM
jgi:hypothetical protein